MRQIERHFVHDIIREASNQISFHDDQLIVDDAKDFMFECDYIWVSENDS